VSQQVFCTSADEPHTLTWLTKDFAHCPGCNLLYTQQPGVLVWVYDPWAVALADALAQSQAREEAARLGYSPDEPLPLPVDDL
jgi:hypothetical protein